MSPSLLESLDALSSKCNVDLDLFHGAPMIYSFDDFYDIGFSKLSLL